jgi:LTXXQ motif family protein
MKLSTRPFVAALLGLALIPVNPASANQEHHQPDAATAASPTPTPTEPPVNMPTTEMMMPMVTMMGQQRSGMPMMDMMGQGGMGMMGQDAMPMMDMENHVEGRIAFLRAELGITGEQTAKWDAFAQSFRDGAARMAQTPASAHQVATGSADLLQRMEQEEQRLATRLEAFKAIRSAYAKLQGVLSGDQKKTAEALLTRSICLGAMGAL